MCTCTSLVSRADYVKLQLWTPAAISDQSNQLGLLVLMDIERLAMQRHVRCGMIPQLTCLSNGMYAKPSQRYTVLKCNVLDETRKPFYYKKINTSATPLRYNVYTTYESNQKMSISKKKSSSCFTQVLKIFN